MGRSKSKSKSRRTRRKFTAEFKADVVRLCRTGIESIGESDGPVEFAFSDEGNNRCGCDPEVECKVLSSGLAPPSPIGPP